MSRDLTPHSSLENLRREAKRWLRALRGQDPAARERLLRAHPHASDPPTLRDVQHALAREHGVAGWTALRDSLAARGDAVTALLSAAARGDVEAVRAVLDAHPGVIDQRAVLEGHSGRRTALHFAMNRPSPEVARLLLERGADPNLRDEGDHALPIQFVAEKGDLEMVRLLVEHGSDTVGAGDHHGLEVIGWATCFARTPNPELVAYLLAHGARHTIFSATAVGAADAIRALPGEVDRAMDATNHHRRPLHLAVIQRQPASLDALLELGADPEREDAAGLTPLDQAALAGERGMAERLIRAGARLRLPAAVALGRTGELARLLRADPDALRPGGRYARLIIRAAERGDGDTIEALLRAGASVHVRESPRTAVDGTHGYTALHAAAFHGNLATIAALLRHGADPTVREDRYWGTPAGWAAYAGHAAARDLILDQAPIDLFDAIAHDRLDRLDEILARDPEALNRTLGVYLTGRTDVPRQLDPAWTPLVFALAAEKGAAVRALLDRGARLAGDDGAPADAAARARAGGREELARAIERLMVLPPAAAPHSPQSDFLRMACLDWRTGGSARAMRAEDAGRILRTHPELARSSFVAAVVCGEAERVARVLAEHPEAASALDGPRNWPPLLYLCSARVDGTAARAVEIARLLLDHGADPNAFYLGGNADIHYTAFTCVMGRGEEQASTHPEARGLVALLLERGADPHDGQVLYNVFADHGSRLRLDDDLVWLLELMREHSLRRGHAALWADPAWPMFSIFGAPSLGDEAVMSHGARLLLEAAVDRDLLGLAEWMLEHGAGPNTSWGSHPGRANAPTLHQLATARGNQAMAALLERYGADPAPRVAHGIDRFIAAVLNGDRSQAEGLARANPGFLADPRPLASAARLDRVDAATLLLELGTSPDVADQAGHGALHTAAGAGALGVATLLIARGAAIDVRETRYQAVPLGVASWAGQPALVELLGRYSREVWELTHTGRVDRLREVLAEEPERARAVSGSGDTPLMWLPADAEAALRCAELLLAAGADPSRRNQRGEAAAEVAERRGLDAVAALLRSRGG